MSVHVPSPLTPGVGLALAEAEVRLRLLGPDPDAGAHMLALQRAIGGLCSIGGCDRPHRSWGMCSTHGRQHARLRRNDAWTINRRARAAS